jgi:hypothetical protein
MKKRRPWKRSLNDLKNISVFDKHPKGISFLPALSNEILKQDLIVKEGTKV